MNRALRRPSELHSGHTDLMELQDWLDIVLRYLQVLAWPVVVFILALVYRSPIVMLLQRLKKYSGWGHSVELHDLLREAKDTSAEALVDETTRSEVTQITDEPVQAPATAEQAPGSNGSASMPTIAANLFDTQRRRGEAVQALDPANFGPSARVIVNRVWDDLQAVVDRIIEDLNLEPAESTSLRNVAVALVNRALINEKTALVAFRIDDLHKTILRVPNFELTSYMVGDFTEAAWNLQQVLEQVYEMMPRKSLP